MLKKDEIAQRIFITLFEFMKISELDWDETYFRFVQFSANHIANEWVYRKGRKISVLPSFLHSRKSACRGLIDEFMEELFDEITVSDHQCPIVAVASIRSDKSFKMDFSYDDSDAMQIGLMYLGLSNSYFDTQIDIPEDVVEYRGELAEKGVFEMPSLIPKK